MAIRDVWVTLGSEDTRRVTTSRLAYRPVSEKRVDEK